jgi:MFS family permease
VLGVSLAALAAGTFSTVGFGALAPELHDALGFSRAEIGVLTALVSVGASIASRRAGVLTDTAGPVRVLALSLILFAAGIAVVAVAPVAGVVMAGALVAGLAYGGIGPPTNVVIAGQMRRRLGFFLSVKQTGVPVGGFLAGIVLPPVALAFSWRWAFALAALTSLIVAAFTVLLRGAGVIEIDPAEIDGNRAPRRERVAIGVFGGVMAGTQWTFLTYLVLYLTDGEGWSLRKAGLVLSLATAVSVGGRLFWGWLSDRPGWRVQTLLTAAGIAAVALAVLATGVGGAAIWPIAVLIGVALVGWNGAFHALITDRAGAGRVGRAAGEAMAFVFGGSVVLPPLLGLISQVTDSWIPLWSLGAGLAVVAALILRVGLRGPVFEPPVLAAAVSGQQPGRPERTT